ncbi:hypothetical protein Dsin_006586 [Dipteronia sinensis]|uniref:Uncharacterized protein n=1 Tax=Dipteronia sinensis TaxID=43782 RepID=A0AAE0B011_9ROSI|nr:hypothetical protein Dsin_006586 [Dipteronia sinensis]
MASIASSFTNHEGGNHKASLSSSMTGGFSSLAKALNFNLQNVKKGSSSVNDFVLKVKTISESLRAVGQKISEYDQILSILNGVGSEYDAIPRVIMSQREKISLQEASYLQMIHEQRMAQLDSVGQIDVPQASANFTSFGNQYDKENQRSNNNNGSYNGNRSRAWTILKLISAAQIWMVSASTQAVNY